MRKITIFFTFEGAKRDGFRKDVDLHTIPALNDYIRLEDGSTYKVWLRRWDYKFDSLTITLTP